MDSYESDETRWTTLIDVDDLAKEEDTPWGWKGARMLPRDRDPKSIDNKMITRALISLSREGSDAVTVREFDFLTSAFVTKDAFTLPEGRNRVSYKSRDVLLVASDLEGGSVTKAGNPKIVKEWGRGTEFKDAKVIFEGDASDIAVAVYIDDERFRGGDIFEVQMRMIGVNSSKYWVRKIRAEHLLGEDDPERGSAGEPPSFQELQVPYDSEVNFVGNLLLITLHSDWSPEPGKDHVEGSIIYVNAHKFIKYGPADRIYHVLFQPSEGVRCETYHVTRNFLICSILDKVKAKLEFHKLEKDGNKLRLVGMDKNSQIRVNHVLPVDTYESDEFWLTTHGYTEPSTVWLADAANMDSKDKKVIRKTGSEGYMVRKLKSLSDRFEASDLHVLQKFARSKDGTEIPYFMIMKKGTQLNKNNPTLLYAYGGFGVSLGPNYAAPTGIAWIERGGVYVEANVRGGGEFGPSWHKVCQSPLNHVSLKPLLLPKCH